MAVAYGSVVDAEAAAAAEEEDQRGLASEWLERKFQLSLHGTTVAQECRAGLTSFVTMSYIVIVNAHVLGNRHGGIPFNDVMIGTAISSAVGSFVCGYTANLPFALAPGLGLSAFLSSYSTSNNISSNPDNNSATTTHPPSWASALAACAISGMLQMLVSTNMTYWLMRGIPASVQIGTVVGMGLLIALVALQEIGVVQQNTHGGGALLELGEGAYSPRAMLGMWGIAFVGLLHKANIKGGVLIAVLSNTLLYLWLLDDSSSSDATSVLLLSLPRPSEALFALDFSGLTLYNHLPLVVTVCVVGVVDIAGVMLGLGRQVNTAEGIPRQSSWVFFAAGLATLVGALFGSSPVTVHIESAAGIAEGGKTGLTACVVGVLFTASLFCVPVLQIVPSVATTPAMFFVGCTMCQQLRNVQWDDAYQALPAFLTLVLIPFTFSVPNGVSFGVTLSYVLFAVDRLVVVAGSSQCCSKA